MSKKVGIIIPSYNQGKYLEQALRSVIENKKHADIQLVVMDGGSTDNSLEIIKKYQEEIDYWQSQKDNGQAGAINEGVKKLQDCQYIMWLNSDDVYDNEFAVRGIVDFAERNKSVLCYGKSKLIDERGIVIEDYPTEAFDLERLSQTCYISQPSVIIRKDVWDEENGLNENLQMCLDYEMWIRIAKKHSLVFYPEYVGNTRIYGETKTSTGQGQHLAEAMTIMERLYKKVPLQWVYAQFLYRHPSVFARKLPVIILKPYLYMIRPKYIREAKLISRY